MGFAETAKDATRWVLQGVPWSLFFSPQLLLAKLGSFRTCAWSLFWWTRPGSVLLGSARLLSGLEVVEAPPGGLFFWIEVPLQTLSLCLSPRWFGGAGIGRLKQVGLGFGCSSFFAEVGLHLPSVFAFNWSVPQFPPLNGKKKKIIVWGVGGPCLLASLNLPGIPISLSVKRD